MPLSLSVTSAGSISMVFTSANGCDSSFMMGGAPMGRNYPAGSGARGPRSARPQSTPAMASTSSTTRTQSAG